MVRYVNIGQSFILMVPSKSSVEYFHMENVPETLNSSSNIKQ